ncbi:hypothetical protein [Pseudoxanthomonas sp. PXM04]|uniref:hypothetical protein n=1 Tax=Pseudoxanthomonas sp. PXM04 TaxID=2769297 RepID=UPI0017869E4E|nr:hypothetical protein [Pseudoxanthomonas sp. PXM04]MBD9376192.1 hypothetical protein [Pseudoxanthomonas sp. PXM04]
MSRNNNQGQGAQTILHGSNTLAAVIALAAGIEVQLGTLVARAHKESGLSAEDWNALDEGKRDELLSATVDAMKAEAEAQAANGNGPPPPNAKKVKARVLVAFGGHHPNEVVSVTPAELKAYAESLDANPAAVAYAEALAKGGDGEATLEA